MSRAREPALIGGLLCVTAALFAVPALYVPGLACLLAAILSRAWVGVSAHAAEVHLSCPAASVQEGERIEFAVTLRRGWAPFPGGTLLPWPGAEELALPRGRSSTIAARAFVGRRGRQSVGPARARIADPLGICARELESGTSELLVLPRLHPLGASALALLDGSGRAPRERPQEVDSLRAHRPGSPASRIHWPTVARSGVLMEHAMTAAGDPRVLVELDAEDPESEDALDRAVRAAASLCHHLARRGGCLVLLPEDRRATVVSPDMRAWPKLHARLAMVSPGPAVRRAPDERRSTTIIRVTARREGSTRSSGPHFRVAATAIEGLPVGFEVAGCAGQLLDRSRGARAA